MFKSNIFKLKISFLAHKNYKFQRVFLTTPGQLAALVIDHGKTLKSLEIVTIG